MYDISGTTPGRSSFSIGEVDIRKFGSQGQQRTSALSLKLSEIELVKRSIHDTPVLLLDDVLSELDSNRQNYLLNSIHDTQTLITCTGLDEFVKTDFRSIRYLKLYRDCGREKRNIIALYIFFYVQNGGINGYRKRIWWRPDPDFGRT